MRRAVLYLRVSTIDQTTANQEREMREIAGRMGCEIVKVYKDHGISGAKGRDKRPAFDALCRAAARREFEMVMAWSVDRLGRSLQDLVGFLSELHSLKIDLFLHQQGLDTTTPAGKAMFQMMGVFAEFERAMIAERVRAGLARALRGPEVRVNASDALRSTQHSKSESVRLWRLHGGPASALLPNGSGSTPERCSGSAALSTAQGPPSHSRCRAMSDHLGSAVHYVL
jgi:Resolvase, N terminal domain